MTPLAACLTDSRTDRDRAITQWLASRLDGLVAEPADRWFDLLQALLQELTQCRSEVAARGRRLEELRQNNLALQREKDRRECLTQIAELLRQLKYIPGLLSPDGRAKPG